MGLGLFAFTKPKSKNTKTKMDFCTPIISLLLHFLLIVCLVSPIKSSEANNHGSVNQTFRSNNEFHRLKMKKMIATRLQQLNKPAVKTIEACLINFKHHYVFENFANWSPYFCKSLQLIAINFPQLFKNCNYDLIRFLK